MLKTIGRSFKLFLNIVNPACKNLVVQGGNCTVVDIKKEQIRWKL